MPTKRVTLNLANWGGVKLDVVTHCALCGQQQPGANYPLWCGDTGNAPDALVWLCQCGESPRPEAQDGDDGACNAQGGDEHSDGHPDSLPGKPR